MEKNLTPRRDMAAMLLANLLASATVRHLRRDELGPSPLVPYAKKEPPQNELRRLDLHI